MRKTSRIRLLLIIGGALFILLVIGAVVLWVQVFYSNNALKSASSTPSSTPTKTVATSVCGTDIINQANTPLANSDQFTLSQIVNTITGLKNYAKDPNCLYIVLVYTIATGDPVASQNYLNEYTQVYDPAIGLSPAFTVSIQPLDTLKNDVAFLVQNAQNATTPKKDNSNVSSGSDAADKFYQGQKQ